MKESLSDDVFAHEWLHCVDILMSDIKSQDFICYSDSEQGKFNELLQSFKDPNKSDILSIKKTII